MRFRFELAGGMLLAGALAFSILPSVPGVAQVSSSSSVAEESSASAAPAAAPDADILASGKHIWQDAACYNCHGTNGQGGHSTDFPNGPSLRKSALDPATMLGVIECGLPDTRMPAWLKGAYTDVSCYGNDLGPVPAGILLAGAYSEAELKDLVAYIQVNFMKQPVPDWTAQ
jgi:mono/diheme cytochrome c family protein